MVVRHVEGGLLISGVATFVATPGADADAAVVQPLLEAEAAAWNADDIDGWLATWTDDAVFWQGVGGGYATFAAPLCGRSSPASSGSASRSRERRCSPGPSPPSRTA